MFYLGHGMFDLVFFMGHDVIEPVVGFGTAILVFFAALLFALLLVVGVISTLAFIFICAGVGLLLSGLSVLWPIVLIAIIIWLMTSKKNKRHFHS